MTPFIPWPVAPCPARTMFGVFIMYSLALSCSCIIFDSLALTQVIAMISYPSFTKFGMTVNSVMRPSFTSFCRIRLTLGCDTPRTLASSLSLLLEFPRSS